MHGVCNELFGDYVTRSMYNVAPLSEKHMYVLKPALWCMFRENVNVSMIC